MSREGPPVSRLQVGTADPRGYGGPARLFLGDGTWVHLFARGEERGMSDRRSLARRAASSLLDRAIPSRRERHAGARRLLEEARRTWNLLPFWLDEWTGLPLRDGVFRFVLCEHVLEHLFLHEALRLVREVRRVLAPGGVFRVSVPDADLRPGESEPVAFHAGRGRTSRDPGRWNDPAVHKTRFNVYSLTLLLEQAAFTVVPLRAYDRDGRLLGAPPERGRAPYPAGSDWEALLRSDYLRRPDSLIVDAIATPAAAPPGR